MRYLSLLLVVFAIITLVCPASAKPMYEAATRVMDMQSHLNGADRLRQLSDLAALAKSQTVIQRTADTLIRLQVTTDPFSVLSTVDARPIEDTNILAITVQADSEDVAKATAGIVACEFIRYYDEFTENTSGKPAIRVLSPAAARPAPRHMPWYLGQRVLEVVAVGVAIGLIIGIPIGFLIGRRARSKRPEPI